MPQLVDLGSAIQKKTKGLVDLGPAPTPITEALGAVEPTTEDLGKYRQMGVKEYRSPAGKLYNLRQAKPISPEEEIDLSWPQPYDPAEAPIKPYTFRAGAVERGAVAAFRATGIPRFLPVKEAGLVGGAAVPSPAELKEMPWHKKIPEVVGWTAMELNKLAASYGILRGIGLLQVLPAKAGALAKAGELAKWFGGAEGIRQVGKGLTEKLTGEDFDYEGATAVLKSAGIGMLISLGFSGAGAIWHKLRPSEQMWALRTLGLKRGATPDQITKAARREVMKYHPDKAEGMRKQFEEVIKARGVLRQKGKLKDIIKRAKAPMRAEKPTIKALAPPARVAKITPVRPPTVIKPTEVAPITPKAPEIKADKAIAETKGKIINWLWKFNKDIFKEVGITRNEAVELQNFNQLIYPQLLALQDKTKFAEAAPAMMAELDQLVKEYQERVTVRGKITAKEALAKPEAVAKPKLVDLGPAKAEPKAEEVVVSKPTDIPKVPKAPVTEQEPTVELKGKEAQVFNEAVRTQEKITAAEQGEVGMEPTGASFTDHLDTFHSYQLPATSKIPQIVRQMKRINGLRLAGKLTPPQANRKIYDLRKELMQTAIREKIALRLSKIGKVKIGLRKSGVYVPEKFATYTKFKDVEPLLGGGQDITRAIQQMDGSLRLKEKVGVEGQAGPIEKYVLWRTRKMTLQKLNWLKEKTIELRSILSAKKGSVKDKQINLILEQIGKADRDAPIKDVLSKKTLASMSKESIKSAQELRQLYDDLIEEQNAARVMRGQDPIPYRHNYSPQILRDTTVWEQLFRGDRAAKAIEKGDLPDYIKPNAPFNPRAQAREADIPYDKRVLSARELAESYVITAAKDIFNTSIIQNNKAFIDQLRSQGYEKSANYLSEWNATAYAGIKPGLDRHVKLPKWAQGSLRYFNRLRNMAVFPLNVAWSLSTQPLSLANTVGRYGLPNTVRGFYQWLKPSVRKQAAQDYYSFIVKSTKRGGVTRQDAANLLGENIKTQKTVGEFVENYSTILLTEMEKLLTGTSIRAAHLHGLKRGLKGEALKQYASDGGGKTQSMYNDEDKPMILRSLLVKSAAPYQTYAFEVANTFREWAGKTGTPPDTKLYAMWSVTRWLAAMIALRLLANQTRGKKWAWWDLVPIPFREALFSPIVRAITGEFGQTAYGLPSPIGTGVRIGKGINDVLETGSWRKLRNEMIRYGPGVFGIPGGVQWSRIVDAIIAYSSGGLKDRRGRLLFKMDTPKDLAKGMFTGVWSTKGGKKYLEKRQGKSVVRKVYERITGEDQNRTKRKKRMEREKRMLRK